MNSAESAVGPASVTAVVVVVALLPVGLSVAVLVEPGMRAHTMKGELTPLSTTGTVGVWMSRERLTLYEPLPTTQPG